MKMIMNALSFPTNEFNHTSDKLRVDMEARDLVRENAFEVLLGL